MERILRFEFDQIISPCEVTFYESLLFLAVYILLWMFVSFRNKHIFNRQQWFAFGFFFIAFFLMLVSTSISFIQKKEDCYVEPISIAFISWEEVFIVSIYLLVVFRMFYIYSQIRDPEGKECCTTKCISTLLKCQNYFICFYFITVSSWVWFHYYLTVKAHTPKLPPSQQLVFVIANLFKFIFDLMLVTTFACLFRIIRNKFREEKQTEEPEAYKRYQKQESRVSWCVGISSVLYIINTTLDSIVKPTLEYRYDQTLSPDKLDSIQDYIKLAQFLENWCDFLFCLVFIYMVHKFGPYNQFLTHQKEIEIFARVATEESRDDQEIDNTLLQRAEVLTTQSFTEVQMSLGMGSHDEVLAYLQDGASESLQINDEEFNLHRQSGVSLQMDIKNQAKEKQQNLKQRQTQFKMKRPNQRKLTALIEMEVARHKSHSINNYIHEFSLGTRFGLHRGTLLGSEPEGEKTNKNVDSSQRGKLSFKSSVNRDVNQTQPFLANNQNFSEDTANSKQQTIKTQVQDLLAELEFGESNQLANTSREHGRTSTEGMEFEDIQKQKRNTLVQPPSTKSEKTMNKSVISMQVALQQQFFNDFQ